MKTKLKLILILLATFCITLACAAITACNPQGEGDGGEPEPPGGNEEPDYGNPATDGYVIKVLYPDGTPVKNTDGDSQYDHPSVELTDADGNRIDPSASSQINASGVAQINYFVPGEYYIKVTDYPTGYAFDNKSVMTSADKAYYTVSISLAPPTPYTVNVKYPDGTAIPDVTVKFMKGLQTVATATSNENGVATSEALERDAYNVVLENLPEGYKHKIASTTIAAWPVTIKTVAVTPIRFEEADKLDEAGIQPWDSALNFYDLNLIRFDKEGDCYGYSAEFDEREEVFFTIHAPKTGKYTIGSKQGNNYVIQFYSDDLSYSDSTLTISSNVNNGNNVQYMQIEEGKTLTFSVKSENGLSGTVELLVCLPVPAPLTVTATSVGTVTLSFIDYHEAILQFISRDFGQGKYEISSLSDTYDVMIVEYVNTYPTRDENSDLTGEYEGFAGNDNGAGDGRNFVYTNNIPQSYVGNIYEYHIIIKDAEITYPAQIKLNIRRIGNATEEKPVTQKTATTNVSTAYADQEGTFTWMPTDGSLTPYERDGKWYVEVGGVEKALVVAITKPLSGQEYSFATVEYFGEDIVNPGEENPQEPVKKNSNLTVYEDLTALDTTWDYSGFIEQYENYVNKDGVYEVNGELKLFLERYMNQRYHDVTGGTDKPAQPWLLGCGYYA